MTLDRDADHFDDDQAAVSTALRGQAPGRIDVKVWRSPAPASK